MRNFKIGCWMVLHDIFGEFDQGLVVAQGLELTAQDEADIAKTMGTILPVSPRARGALFDMYVSNPDINSGYPLEGITVPVLIIHAEDDPLASYDNARAMAERIPSARLFTVESGGHMLLGHAETIRSKIEAFLNSRISGIGSSVTSEGDEPHG